MAYTADDLGPIERAIASGNLTVRYADRQVTYRSLDEMIRIRDLIRGEVDPASRAPTRRYGSFRSGL